MKDGFIKVSAGTPDVRVADCEYNADQIIAMIVEMEKKGARIMVTIRVSGICRADALRRTSILAIMVFISRRSRKYSLMKFLP